ncbi:helix-turn-helix transcriptional regulator [Streptomyces sp. NPDC048606]|uniref:helix-turn-helix transcriptional regulator n=1 Tax=Streptomyces sp. NPDC048606 TaxID=3154726 RepID=UPI0034442A74
MARGTAKFAPEILKTLRASRQVDGCLLSAADLAVRLGTSKARVLAYEAGTSVPEPRRISQIARLFRVHPRELYEPSRGQPEQIRDLRSYAGLTAEEVAASLFISRAAYRNIERQAILPARDDGTLPLRLAEVLDIPLAMIHRALDNHPVAQQRRVAIAGHLEEIFSRASELYRPAVVDPTEQVLLQIAALLRRPSSVVCRLVNHELTAYRFRLKRLEVSRLDEAFAQSVRVAAEHRKRIGRAEESIRLRPFQSATVLVRFLAEAMTSQQWRMMVTVLEHGSAWAPSETSPDEEAAQAWRGLLARGFVIAERDRHQPEASRMLVTHEGWDRCATHAARYACLYPRISAPPSMRQMPAAVATAIAVSRRLPHQGQPEG